MNPTRALLFVTTLSCACASTTSTTPPSAPAVAPAADGRAGIDAFNDALREATRRMDDPAVVALWEEDGVSLLPGMKPIVGRRAIAAFMAQLNAQMPGAKMESFEMECSGVEVSGDWASEWCTEHQVVSIPSKPTFDGKGKLLFVLHKGQGGKWRLVREMWNEA